jgi:hypothetical protein
MLSMGQTGPGQPLELALPARPASTVINFFYLLKNNITFLESTSISDECYFLYILLNIFNNYLLLFY